MNGHDHIHFLLECPPSTSVSTAVARLKSVSSKFFLHRYGSQSGLTIPERFGGIFAFYSPVRILRTEAEIVKRRITRFLAGLRLNRLFDILTEKWFSVLVETFPNALELGLLRCLNR